MKIALIGMSMVGKTILAQKIATHYDILHIDTDLYIEQKHNTSIPNLFQKHGEEHFRIIEQETIREIVDTHKSKSFILSCGGGLPCFYNNIDILNAHTYTIYLEANLLFFENQLKNNTQWRNRPLLTQTENPLQYIQQLLEKRKPFYEQAKHTQIIHADILQTFNALIHHIDSMLA